MTPYPGNFIPATKLESHGNSVLNTIRLIKDVTGNNFQIIRDMVTQLPFVIKYSVSQDEAIMIMNQFKWSGAKILIEKCL